MDNSAEAVEGLGDVHVCAECEATWISEAGVIDSQTLCKGEDLRAMQSQIDHDDFLRGFNDPEGWGL